MRRYSELEYETLLEDLRRRARTGWAVAAVWPFFFGIVFAIYGAWIVTTLCLLLFLFCLWRFLSVHFYSKTVTLLGLNHQDQDPF